VTSADDIEQSDVPSDIGDAVIIRDRIVGCLLGGAIGDAWGGGHEGALPCPKADFPNAGQLSDDTQLTQATCEAILERGNVEAAHIASRFRAWFEAGRIRGMGASTYKALRDLAAGAHWALAGAKGERAAGNGAVMRVAPLAFLLDPADHSQRRLIRDVCRITHHHDEAYVGALAVVNAVRLMAFGGWQPGMNLLEQMAPTLPDSRVRDRLIRYAEFPAGTTPRAVAGSWGSSGYVVESVSLALFAAQTIGHQTFEAVIRGTVEAGGDTDTVASIAGQIAGTWIGEAGLPGHLLTRIREIEELKRVTERFANHVGKHSEKHE
jgi:ADP-ribosyl-[dinitrogen reductase] hydrolase